MRKCIAYAIIKDHKILSLDFMPIRSKELIHYITWNEQQEKLGYKYESIYGINKAILNIMKANNLYCDYVSEFGARFYNIYIMDLDKQEKYFGRYLFDMEG